MIYSLFTYLLLFGNWRSMAETLRSELLSNVCCAGFLGKSPPKRPEDKIQLEGREQQSKYLCSYFTAVPLGFNLVNN